MVRSAYTLTTAGEAREATGANESCTCAWLSGTERSACAKALPAIQSAKAAVVDALSKAEPEVCIEMRLLNREARDLAPPRGGNMAKLAPLGSLRCQRGEQCAPVLGLAHLERLQREAVAGDMLLRDRI